jgi:hypoxanthine phosphoribosyltransferase
LQRFIEGESTVISVVKKIRLNLTIGYMKKIKIRDKEFRTFIPYEKIRSTIEIMADKMNVDLEGKNPLFVCILNGSFMFAAEIYKRIEIIESEITFVKLASYQGDKSTGEVKQLIGLNENVRGRTVVVLEDIVDTGITIDNILTQLEGMEPAEVKIATLLLKPDALVKKVQLDYVGLEIPNDFIVGYGLDYDGQGRNLIDIYTLIK